MIDICTEMKAAGHAGSLNIDLLSADHLAMETLLRFVQFDAYLAKFEISLLVFLLLENLK